MEDKEPSGEVISAAEKANQPPQDDAIVVTEDHDEGIAPQTKAICEVSPEEIALEEAMPDDIPLSEGEAFDEAAPELPTDYYIPQSYAMAPENILPESDAPEDIHLEAAPADEPLPEGEAEDADLDAAPRPLDAAPADELLPEGEAEDANLEAAPADELLPENETVATGAESDDVPPMEERDIKPELDENGFRVKTEQEELLPETSLDDHGDLDDRGGDLALTSIKLFVNRVPRDFTEIELRKVFEVFGPVQEVANILDRETKVHKRASFVRMASLTHADEAIKKLNGQTTLDATCGTIQVRYANGEADRIGLLGEHANPAVEVGKVFVGFLSKGTTEEDLRTLFRPFGPINEIVVLRDLNNGESRGCGFVKLRYKERAIVAIASLQGSQKLPGSSRPMELRFAESKKNHTSGGGGQTLPLQQSFVTPRAFAPLGVPFPVSTVCGADVPGPPGGNVYLFHVPNTWREADAHQHFTGFGTLLSVRLVTNPSTGQNRGFGFVSYNHPGAAALAVHQMDGYQIGNKRLKVSIKQGEERHARDYLVQLEQYPRCGGPLPPQPAFNPRMHQPTMTYAPPNPAQPLPAQQFSGYGSVRRGGRSPGNTPRGRPNVKRQAPY